MSATRVLFTAAAQADLDEALNWYEAHAPEIVPGFHEALRATVERIGKNPKQFSPGRHETRRALLRKFPYLIIFREVRQTIYIVGVFHTSRDPIVWERRTR